MTLSPGLSLPYTISGVWWLSPGVTSMGSGAVGLGEMSFGDAGSVCMETKGGVGFHAGE